MTDQTRLVKVAKEDQDWVTPEEATEVVSRAQDGQQPVSHSALLRDLLTAED